MNNTGTAAINGWTLASSFPGDQRVTNPWNANGTSHIAFALNGTPCG